MQQHIPDTGNTYILITPSDIKDLRFTMIICGAAGLVGAMGAAYWWEIHEDDRKERRAHKKRDKELKAAKKAWKKGTEVFAVRLKQKGTENETTIRVQVPLGTTYKEAYEDLLTGNLNPAFKIVE